MTDAYRLELTVTPDRYDRAVDLFWVHDTLALSEAETPGGSIRLTGSFQSDDALKAALHALTTLGQISTGTESLAELQQQWQARWRAGAEPHLVGDIGVGLPEHEALACAHWLSIDPGASFGHGAHPTTSMMLDLLQGFAGTTTNWTAADIGTGSGVLAIAAAALGATSVVGVDTSADAIDAALANVTRNGVSEQVRMVLGTTDTLDGSYGVVLANMIAGTLLPMAAELNRLTEPQGRLLVSGLRDDQRQRCLDVFSAFELVDERNCEGWCALALRPTPES